MKMIIAALMLFAGLVVLAHGVEPRHGAGAAAADAAPAQATLTENQAYALNRSST